MKRGICLLALMVGVVQVVAAQTPPPVWSGSFGGGLALTGGNTDTRNFNLGFDAVRDPKTRNVMKATASYLRGTQNKLVNLDRTAVVLRDEHTVSHRLFVFGQNDYLRDKFKEIIFLWAPGGGLGINVLKSDATKLEFDAGAGGIFEKNPGRKTTNKGSVTAGETLRHKLSSNASLSETWSSLWKMDDFSDSLTNLSLGLTTSVAKRLEVKLEFRDSYKNKPASAKIKKNDTAFVTTFMVKF